MRAGRARCLVEIETRDRPPELGNDVLLSVITDGSHAGIDLRPVDADDDNEAASGLGRFYRDAGSRARARR